jgi:hypothetical protein
MDARRIRALESQGALAFRQGKTAMECPYRTTPRTAWMQEQLLHWLDGYSRAYRLYCEQCLGKESRNGKSG